MADRKLKANVVASEDSESQTEIDLESNNHDQVNGESKVNSKLFQPLSIANGRIRLQHRVLYAPMTRLRGIPLQEDQDEQKPTRAWYPDELAAKYYGQRASEGGLLITEGVTPSKQASSLIYCASSLFAN